MRNSNISQNKLESIIIYICKYKFQSVSLTVWGAGLLHLLSQSIVFQNTTQFFSAAILQVVNMNFKITDTVKLNADSTSAKSSEKFAEYLGGLEMLKNAARQEELN